MNEQKKKEILTPLLVEAGAALMDCQRFEYGIALFLFYPSHVGIKGLDTDKMTKIMDDVEKRTAGQLLKLLKEHVQMSEEKEKILSEALAARNKIIHRMLVDNSERIVQKDDREELIKEIRKTRAKVNKGDAILQPVNFELGDKLFGIDEKYKTEMMKKFFED
jgi:hypothetical protein